MITGRPKPSLTLAPDEQTQLRSLAASRTLPHSLLARAKLVLWSAQGQSSLNAGFARMWAPHSRLLSLVETKLKLSGFGITLGKGARIAWAPDPL